MKFCCIILLLISFPLTAQLPVDYYHMNSEDGLSSSECYHIMQDSKGYIWISTSKGVSRYNGKSIKNYTTKNGLTNNVVFESGEDTKGRIWFRTSDGTLCYFLDDSIYGIPANDLLRAYIKKRTVSHIYVDGEDNIWLSLYESRLPVCVSNHFSKVRILQNTHLSPALYFINDTDYLLLSDNTDNTDSLIILNKGMATAAIKRPQSKVRMFSNALTYDDSLILFSDGMNKIFSFGARQSTSETSFPLRIITVIKEGRDCVWISIYKKGIYKYRADNLSKPLEHLFDGYTITSLMHDYEGGMWFSTLENGIFYKRSLQNLRFVLPDDDKPATFRLLKAAGTQLFMATDKPALYSTDTGNRICRLKLTDKERDNMNDVRSFDAMYYVSGYGYINVYDQALKLKRSVFNIPDSFTSDALHTFKQYQPTGKGEFIASDGYILALGSGGTVTRSFSFPEKIRLFYYDTASAIAYVSTKKGLYLVGRDRAGRLCPADELNHDLIISVFRLHSGQIAFVSQEGKIFIRSENRYTEVYHSQEEIVNDAVNDTNDNIWLATNKGIILLQKGKYFRAISFTKADGLQSDEINHIAWFNKHVWYSTINAVFHFAPAELLNNSVPPKVEIEQFTVNGRTLPVPGLKSLEHDENTVTAKAHCLSFIPGESSGLFFRLKGFENSWHNSNGDQTVKYTNLPPGRYVLEIKGINAKGIISAQAKTIAFEIRKPYWFTWWFICGEISIGMIVLFAGAKLYTRKVRRDEGEKTRINKMIADYRMTALRAQINPHFIFNCINSIQRYIIANDPEQAYHYLSRFSMLIRLVLDYAEENTISLAQELEIINIYLELEQLRFEDAFVYHIQVAEQADIHELTVPVMIMQPYVENAIWHGIMNLEHRRTGAIHIRIKYENNILIIEIEDNGIGLKQAALVAHKKHRSKGIKINSRRADILNVLRNTNNGKVEVEEIKDADNNVQGTRVIITIPQSNDTDE